MQNDMDKEHFGKRIVPNVNKPAEPIHGRKTSKELEDDSGGCLMSG